MKAKRKHHQRIWSTSFSNAFETTVNQREKTYIEKLCEAIVLFMMFY